MCFRQEQSSPSTPLPWQSNLEVPPLLPPKTRNGSTATIYDNHNPGVDGETSDHSDYWSGVSSAPSVTPSHWSGLSTPPSVASSHASDLTLVPSDDDVVLAAPRGGSRLSQYDNVDQSPRRVLAQHTRLRSFQQHYHSEGYQQYHSAAYQQVSTAGHSLSLDEGQQEQPPPLPAKTQTPQSALMRSPPGRRRTPSQYDNLNEDVVETLHQRMREHQRSRAEFIRQGHTEVTQGHSEVMQGLTKVTQQGHSEVTQAHTNFTQGHTNVTRRAFSAFQQHQVTFAEHAQFINTTSDGETVIDGINPPPLPPKKKQGKSSVAEPCSPEIPLNSGFQG